MAFFVYMLASKRNGTIYIGMTDNLVQRVWQHRNNVISGFTQRYGVKTLVWYEVHESRDSAFMRERKLKKWRRAWKLALVEQENARSVAWALGALKIRTRRDTAAT
jgi:putative endonuclease